MCFHCIPVLLQAVHGFFKGNPKLIPMETRTVLDDSAPASKPAGAKPAPAKSAPAKSVPAKSAPAKPAAPAAGGSTQGPNYQPTPPSSGCIRVCFSPNGGGGRGGGGRGGGGRGRGGRGDARGGVDSTWGGGADKYIKFVLCKENMDTQV